MVALDRLKLFIILMQKGGFMLKYSICLCVGLSLIVPAVVQADEYTTMKDILFDMETYVEYLEDSLNQEVVHIQADIITEKGTTFTRTLHEGYTYGVAAFGDWRIKDLDIAIYKDVDGEWVKMTSDSEADNTPHVIHAPSSTGAYMIELTVYKWLEDNTVAHYGMLIYHEIE